jgi:predicted Zn-dependent protease with MMP-like domain
MTRSQFEALVREAMRSIPRRFRERMQNVENHEEEAPDQTELPDIAIEPDEVHFGLYQGTPLTERQWGHGNALPDRITIYQRPLEEECESEDELFEEICLTLIHEAGHYFGLSEQEIQEAEDVWYEAEGGEEGEAGEDGEDG